MYTTKVLVKFFNEKVRYSEETQIKIQDLGYLSNIESKEALAFDYVIKTYVQNGYVRIPLKKGTFQMVPSQYVYITVTILEEEK